jgi:hypothetical protein
LTAKPTHRYRGCRSGHGRLFPFAATLAAPTLSARRCRDSLQRPAASDPASNDPRLAARMVIVGHQGVPDGRSSTRNGPSLDLDNVRWTQKTAMAAPPR